VDRAAGEPITQAFQQDEDLLLTLAAPPHLNNRQLMSDDDDGDHMAYILHDTPPANDASPSISRFLSQRFAAEHITGYCTHYEGMGFVLFSIDVAHWKGKGREPWHPR
jgi:hypothetical protein